MKTAEQLIAIVEADLAVGDLTADLQAVAREATELLKEYDAAALVASNIDMTKRFQSRAHAVDALRNMNGRELRELADRGASLKQLQDALRQGIDLADMPDALAAKYAVSDRAWHRFLNDIIRDAIGQFRAARVSL